MRRDSTKDVRERLLEAGVATFHQRGFNGCSVQDITEAAGVPKGSFYNHFESKEALGAAALEHFWQEGAGDRLQILSEPGRAPRDRLRAYFEQAAADMAAIDYTCGCLVGNLAAELSDQSKLVSAQLYAILASWASRRRDQRGWRSRDARQFRPERLGGRRPARPHRKDRPPAQAVRGRPLHPPPALTSPPRFFSTGIKMTGHLNTLAPPAHPPGPKAAAEPSALLADAPLRQRRSFDRLENSITEFAADTVTAGGHIPALGRGVELPAPANKGFAAPTRDTRIRQDIR